MIEMYGKGIYGIIGAGRGCYEIADLINFMNYEWTVGELWDENKSGIDTKLNIKISNKINPDLAYIISPGDPVTRKILYEKTKGSAKYMNCALGKNIRFGSRSDIGSLEGLIFQSDGVISCDVKIGKHVFLNFRSGIGHDSSVGDFSFIGTNTTLMGYVKLGEGVMIGCGANILPDVEIGDWSVIGAGSVVTKNVPPYEVWVGNPAKFLRKNEVEFKQ